MRWRRWDGGWAEPDRRGERRRRVRPAGRDGVERRLAAILAADVVGYSSLMERDEDRTLARLKAHRREFIEPLIAEYQGRVVKLMGDGALVEFASVVDAVRCAVLIQQGVAEREAAVPEAERIRSRIGINLGDVIHEADGDLYGDGVNVAARLEQLAAPGGVVVSGTAYDHPQGKLELPLDFAGEQRVKNIERLVRAYRVRLDGKVAWLKSPSRRARRFALRLATAAALALVAGLGAWHFWPRESTRERPGIAVLPFTNLGGDEATGRLADGITEDTITDLARFRDLDVIARNSTEVYKGKPVDVRQVGKALGVRCVLEGSIQRQADRVQVTAQLIDAGTCGQRAGTGRPGTCSPSRPRWRRRSRAASAATTCCIGRGWRRPGDLTAYDLYLLGVGQKQSRRNVGEVEEAKRLFDRAIAADPQLARAYVGRAWAHEILTTFGPPYDFAPGVAAMEADARAAIAIDPQDAEAHVVPGEALYNEGQFAESAAQYDTALRLNPGSADIAALAGGIICFMGQAERAATLADLNPAYPDWYGYYLGPAYYLAGRDEETVRVLGRMPPEKRLEFGWLPLAAAQSMLGHDAEARAARDAVLAAAPSFSAEAGLSAEWRITGQPERERFIEGVRRAGLPVCAEPAAAAGLATRGPVTRV